MNYDWTTGVGVIGSSYLDPKDQPSRPNYVGQSVPNIPKKRIVYQAPKELQNMAPIDVDGEVKPKNNSRAPSDLSSPEVETVSQLQESTKDIAKNTKAQVDLTKQQSADYKNSMRALAGVELLVDVLNANSAYSSAEGQAGLNITMARNQASDARFRGHQAAMDAQSEGYNAGQDAILAMAAQGQDVSGAAVNKIQGSYEAVGVYNGMREETNAMREALGYQLEEANYDYQLKTAAMARDTSYISSGLNFGARMYAYS